MTNGCFQKDIPKILHSELTGLEAIGEGGYAVAYRAEHAQFGTVVYKKLNAERLRERYSTDCSVLMRLHFEAAEISTN